MTESGVVSVTGGSCASRRIAPRSAAPGNVPVSSRGRAARRARDADARSWKTARGAPTFRPRRPTVESAIATGATSRVTSMDTNQLARFQGRFGGEIIQPGEPRYDEARALYNGMIDKRPRLIARCTDAADVVAAVEL